MVEHYAAGEGQGEEAPKVTSACRLLACYPFLLCVFLNVSGQCFHGRVFFVVHAPPAPLKHGSACCIAESSTWHCVVASVLV